jgi:hypothetical protein
MKKLLILMVVVAAPWSLFLPVTVSAGETVAIARGGKARLPVVVSPEASGRVSTAAGNLAHYLGKITGATFKTRRGEGTMGIAVGNYRNFPKLGLSDRFDPGDITRRDEYLIRTHDEGVHLIGATDLAAQHAVWDFLYRIGYRRFFPTETWEVVPEERNLRVEMDVFESPDFYNRSAPRGAPWSDGEMWKLWKDRNRVTSAVRVSTGHVYGSIIRRHEKVFEQHPEYLALRDGERGGSKFCIANEELRRLVVDDAVGRIENNPDADAISMDPSDGSGWCECEDCRQMGSVSDRVVLLSNAVAEAINELGYGEKYVGIYAYNVHSPPPSVDVHPNVIVSIATAFIKGGYSFEELIEGWSKRAEIIGIRDYHDVHTWTQCMPCRARGGRIRYLTERIPYYYEKGARLMNSEASDSWGANGLGFYLTTRLLWDVDAAEKVDALVEDFLIKAFGRAHEPMGAFYRLISRKPEGIRTNEDLVACMYQHLAEARRLAENPKVLARLEELILYTRYVELYFAFGDADGRTARKKAAQKAYRHAYRMQDTMLIHIVGLFRYLRRRKIGVPSDANPGRLSVDKALKRKKSEADLEEEKLDDLMGGVRGSGGQGGMDSEVEAIGRKMHAVDLDDWKSERRFTEEEIAGILEAGLKNNERDNPGFEPVSYSTDLVPAADLDLEDVKRAPDNNYRSRNTMYTWFGRENGKLILEVTGGKIYDGVMGDVDMRLLWVGGGEEKVVREMAVPPDGETHKVVFESPHKGLHRLEWNDHGDMTHIDWPPGQPMSFRAGAEDAQSPRHRWIRYFYVPRGTKVVGGFATRNNGAMFDGSGRKVFDFRRMEGADYFSVPVREGEDGRLWKFHRGTGTRRLMTVPPYMARDETELLLPREVVEADK